MFEHTARALLMRPQHAAREAGVTTHTLANWANDGRLSVVRTVGGQRRYLAGEIADLAHKRRKHRRGTKTELGYARPICTECQIDWPCPSVVAQREAEQAAGETAEVAA